MDVAVAGREAGPWCLVEAGVVAAAAVAAVLAGDGLAADLKLRDRSQGDKQEGSGAAPPPGAAAAATLFVASGVALVHRAGRLTAASAALRA